MRLLNVHDFSLRDFPAEPPQYVITSHRWVEGQEAAMRDLREGLDFSKSGHRKVKGFVDYAVRNVPGIDWIWLDTCCIDKASSQEVTEAINSMFKWYLRAEACLAYLHDVTVADDMVSFSESTWFKRGWTLQELLAPRLVVFLTQDWRVIGHKGEIQGQNRWQSQIGLSLTQNVSAITHIPENVLQDYTHSQQLSARAKLQWTSGRGTTKEEDLVYCLIGLLGVSMPIVYGEGVDKATRRLIREVAESGEVLTGNDLGSGHSSATSCTSPLTHATAVRRMYLPFERNRQFVGRTAELDTLQKRLLIDQDCQKLTLVGLGGIGKTQIALNFAWHLFDTRLDCSIFWVSALSVETIEQSFGEIARACHLSSAAHAKENIKRLVKRHLSSKDAGRWLLIVDNIDDAKLLHHAEHDECLLDYLPESSSGLMLFTTRNLENAQLLTGKDSILMDRMLAQDAFDLLAKSLREGEAPSDGEVIEDLLAQLDYLPLAITQAAAYININQLPIVEYVDLLHSTEQDLVHIMSTEIRDRTRYQQAANAVATTWIISFKQIMERDALAVDLLKYMSCIEWKAIPQSILPPVKPKARMMSAIGRLCSYSFISRRRQEKSYDMHRLVHLAIRIWVDQNEGLQKLQESTIHTLSKVFPSEDYANRQTWREQLPHVARISKEYQCNRVEEKGKLCLLVGRCLMVDGRTEEAEMWQQMSCDLRNAFVESHPDRLDSQHELARTYWANGKIQKAVILLENIVEIKEKVLAEDDPSRLTSQHELGRIYPADGQNEKAVRLLEVVVKIRRKTLAEHHPDLVASQHELARALRADRQIAEAGRLLEHVTSMREKLLAEDHPHRLASQYELARVYEASGRVKEAIALLEHVVRIRKRILTDNHPSRLASLHELGKAYLSNDQAQEAVDLLKHVVRTREQMLTENHRNRLESQHELAKAYQRNGQMKEAIELFQHVVQIREGILAKDHPSRLASQYDLAGAFMMCGQTVRALQLLEHVVERQEHVLAEDHPDRIASQIALRAAKIRL